MKRIEAWIHSHRELVTYVIAGGLTTVVNIAAFWLLTHFTSLSTLTANTTAVVLSILFAYVINRIWVFQSKASGMKAVYEFVMFMVCRLGSLVIDDGLVWLGVDCFAPGRIPEARMELWALVVKLGANVVVIAVNYVFSKLLIFRKKS